MNKQKVIAGQTWTDNYGAGDVKVGETVDGRVLYSWVVAGAPITGNMGIEAFLLDFTFKPTNELEALAVHHRYNWLKNDCVDGYDGVYKVSENGRSIDCVNDGEGILGSIVIAKHNELFGITEELGVKMNNNIKIYPVNAGIVRANLDKMRELGAQLIETGVKMNIDDIEKEYGVALSRNESQYIKLDVNPVYTQAMCDAGELPSEGVSCEICYGRDELFFKGSVIAYYNDMVWLNMEGKYPSCRILDVEFRPIKTDKEKLIDSLILEVDTVIGDDLDDASLPTSKRINLNIATYIATNFTRKDAS